MLELLVTIATGEFSSKKVLDAIEEAIDGSVDLYLIDAAIEAMRETWGLEVEFFYDWPDSSRCSRWPGDHTYRRVPWHSRVTHLETDDPWEKRI